MRTSNTLLRRQSSSGTSSTDSDARQQPAVLPPSASSNPESSRAQPARTTDAAARNRMIGNVASPRAQVRSHIEDDVDAQDAVRAHDYELQLVKWANAAPEREVDGRREAVERIRDVIGNVEGRLKLSGLGLTSLPKLPDGLTSLWADDNQLTSLPDLPDGLTVLQIFHNPLNSLQNLPQGLLCLNVNDRQLASLSTLPQGLKVLTRYSNTRYTCSDHLSSYYYFECAADVLKWQSDHPELLAGSIDVPDKQPPSSPGLAAVAPPDGSNATAPTAPVTLPTTTPAAKHTDLTAIHAPPVQQPSLTPDKLRRVEQLLGTITHLQQSTFTPEDRINVLALLSMQDAIETVVSQPAATLPREEMAKLIAFTQIKLEDDREKQQLAAELAALNTDYPDTAKSGLLLYNLLSKTLIGLHNNAPQLTSGVANTGTGMASSKAKPAGVAISVLNIVPMVGNQLASATRAAFNSIDQNHVRQNLLRGLDAMASIDNAGTPLEQQATMQRLTHALVYRLALHHCAKPPSGAGKVTTAVKVAVGTDDRSISNYQNYAKKITDAILTSQRTFSGATVEVVVSHLLAAALTGATRTQDRARVKARLLGEKHQQIIATILAPAGPGAMPAAASTSATPQSGHLPGTSKPAPDAAGQTGVHVLTAQMAQITQQLAALYSDQQVLTAQREEDKRTVQTLQSAYQELMAQQDEDKRTLQTLQSANQELMAQLAQNKQRLDQNDQRLEQNDQRVAAMESDNSNLRTELQTLANKPVDPMISTLHHAVDGLYAQLASLQTNLNLAHSSTANAHAELQTLTTQLYLLQGVQESLKEGVNALQLSLDDTPEKAEVAALGNQVAGLVQHKQRWEADVRMLKRSVSKLEVESDSGTSPSGGLVHTLMPRTDPVQASSAQGQSIQIEELRGRVDAAGLAIVEIQEKVSIHTAPPPAPDPNQASNLQRLFGNFFNGASGR